MRIKYFFLISTFYLQATISGPLKNVYRRKNLPTTRSYLRFRRRDLNGHPSLSTEKPNNRPIENLWNFLQTLALLQKFKNKNIFTLPGLCLQILSREGWLQYIDYFNVLEGPVAPAADPATGYTLPPGFTIPLGFTMPGNNSDNVTLEAGNTFPPGFSMNAQDLERIKPQGPTSSTSAIKYPIMPRIDENNTEPCDVIAYFCPKSYKTGKVCGRATNYIYKTFETYCQLDYVNCKEQTNVWKIGYMGECIPKTDFVRLNPPPIYEYHDDYFLDDIFVMDETFHEDIMEKLEPIHNPVKPSSKNKG